MATVKKFTISEAIKFGWEIVKKRFWFFAGLSLVMWLVEMVFSRLSDSVDDKQAFLLLLISLVSWVIQVGLTLGYNNITLLTVDGKQANFEDLVAKFDVMLILKYIGASLLTGLAVILGLILLIIPGIIVAIRLGFFPFVLLEKKLGPIETVKESWRMTEGHVMDLGLLMLCLLGINLLGLLAFVVGLLVTAPLSMLASAYVYRKLASK